MLILARKIGESILIGDNIEICIVESSNGIIKLGITAPQDVKVFRKELLTEVRNENIESIKNADIILKRIK